MRVLPKLFVPSSETGDWVSIHHGVSIHLASHIAGVSILDRVQHSPTALGSCALEPPPGRRRAPPRCLAPALPPRCRGRSPEGFWPARCLAGLRGGLRTARLGGGAVR